MPVEDSCDLDLLARWRSGDTRAGSDLLKRHFASLHRFFSTKAQGHVEDLIQQTFVACVESKDQFRAESSYRTYLFCLARMTLYNHYRKHHRTSSFDFTTRSVADLELSPTGVLAQRDEQRLLSQALRHVPVDQQIALELTYWEGMSASEVAQVLGIPENTVSSRLRRAKEHLRKALAQITGRLEAHERALGMLMG
jgi:RNA polymerase sigma-70 factor (ECF subfamily)